MNYRTFLSFVRPFPLFGEDVLTEWVGGKNSKRMQLSRWARQGKIVRLKRGLYTLPEEFRKAPLSLRWLANTLYSPSYLSLEYMLSWYDMIPERVVPLTSVTTLKTSSFSNPLGNFVYRTLKRELFFGFEEISDEFNQPVLVATPEKALLDFIYLYPRWENSEAFLEENLRLQQLDQLKRNRMKKFVSRFGSQKMDLAAQFVLKRLGKRL